LQRSYKKNVDLFGAHKVFTAKEVEARQEIMYESFANILTIEAKVMVQMMETGVIPACAQDLQTYAGTNLAGDRPALYKKLADETAKLQALVDSAGGDGHGFDDAKGAATYARDKLKVQMGVVRAVHDQAESKMAAGLYPYPTYAELLFSHHSLPAPE